MKINSYLLIAFAAFALHGCCGFVKCGCENEQLQFHFSEDPTVGFSQQELDSMWIYVRYSNVAAVDSFLLTSQSVIEYFQASTEASYTVKNPLLPALQYNISEIATLYEKKDDEGCCKCERAASYSFMLNGNKVAVKKFTDRRIFKYVLTK